eukprot:6574578-Prymnesium_polylepis.1
MALLPTSLPAGGQYNRAEALPTPLSSSNRSSPAWHAGYCDKTDDAFGSGDCSGGEKGLWYIQSAAHNWRDAASACLKLCRLCARCRYVSMSLRFAECDWFHSCATGRLLVEPEGFQSIQMGAGAGSTVPLRTEDLRTASVRSRAERGQRTATLDATVFRSLAELRASPWHAYLDRVYSEGSLTFPLPLARLEFFYTRLVPSTWFDARNPSHQAELDAALADGLRQGDLFQLKNTPSDTLFRYVYP